MNLKKNFAGKLTDVNFEYDIHYNIFSILFKLLDNMNAIDELADSEKSKNLKFLLILFLIVCRV